MLEPRPRCNATAQLRAGIPLLFHCVRSLVSLDLLAALPARVLAVKQCLTVAGGRAKAMDGPFSVAADLVRFFPHHPSSSVLLCRHLQLSFVVFLNTVSTSMCVAPSYQPVPPREIRRFPPPHVVSILTRPNLADWTSFELNNTARLVPTRTRYWATE